MSSHPKHNLPAQPMRLVGREADLETIRSYLDAADRSVRLLTLTGPGGTGKTRLAIEIARSSAASFEDGVFFVDLAAINHALTVPLAIARTLGIRDSGEKEPFDALTEFLRDKSALVVLDNFEHLADAAPTVGELLCACNRLCILVTSRARLRLRWEQVVPVPPLPLPQLAPLPTLDALARVPSVALFLQRVRALDPNFSLIQSNARTIAELCVQLDGLPLALELAAARVDVLSPHSMLRRGRDVLDLLATGTSDAPPRHSTMRRAIAWSYDLLDSHGQALFRRLAVFIGGWTSEAAATVCWRREEHPQLCSAEVAADGMLDQLASLASKSLVRREIQPDGEIRFGMLETIRAFAQERLADCGELEEVSRGFRDYFLALAECAEHNLTGPEQSNWMDRLELEHDNLRASLLWCLEHGAAEEGLRLASALWRFWFTRGHLREGGRWLEDLLKISSQVTAYTRAKALNAAGNLAHARGDLRRAEQLHQDALAIRENLGDEQGIAISLNSLANVAVDRGDYADARALYEHSLTLRRVQGDARGIAVTLNNLSVIARIQGDWEAAAALSADSLAVFRDLGDKQGIALSLVTLGMARYEMGDHASAAALHRQSIALFGELENRRELVECVEVLALVALSRGDAKQAARLLGAADAALEEIGSSMRPATNPRYSRSVADIRGLLGDDEFAIALAEGRESRLEDAAAVALATEQTTSVLATSMGAAGALKSSEPGQTKASVRLQEDHAALSRREQQVMALLARGLTNRQIAAELTITERTAESHVCRILSKLGLSRRAQLTAWAVEHELQAVRLH